MTEASIARTCHSANRANERLLRLGPDDIEIDEALGQSQGVDIGVSEGDNIIGNLGEAKGAPALARDLRWYAREFGDVFA